MPSPFLFTLNICTLTILLFTVHLLVIRSNERQAYIPLALCLVCTALLFSRPLVATFLPQLQVYRVFLSLPALLAIAPSFWLYVQGITSETPWRLEKTAARHFALSAIGLGIALFAFLLPSSVTRGLIAEGNEQILEALSPLVRYFTYGALIITFVLVLGWVLQAGYYVYRVVRRLSSYRQHLKDVFASTETREANWLTWLLLALGGVWFLSAVNIVWDNLFHRILIGDTVMHSLYLLLVWSISLWGLRQKPGFEELYSDGPKEGGAESPNESALGESSEQLDRTKYSRSGLGKDQSASIAEAIERAMREDKLYLDNAISLQKLAKHIHTPSNYVSQTLNETLQTSFFDFINKYRVMDAQQRLLASDDSVVDIAMDVGFNAKSSFYTAFKKEVQQTPLQYRKIHQ